MTIVDTHCHTGLHKYEPVESLLYHMQASGVDRAVLIQYAGNADNAYLTECLERHPGKLSATMIVAADDDGSAMRHWAERGIRGIRLRADSRAEGPDPLAQWRTAADLNLVVSAPCSPQMLVSESFGEVVARFPDLRIALEHLAGVGRNSEPPHEVFRGAMKLARHPNLLLKLPGFGEFCQLPCPFDQVPDLARMALEAFGPERMMWGSDYPPVSSREGYDSALRFPLNYFADLSDEERERIFGGTALSLWEFQG